MQKNEFTVVIAAGLSSAVLQGNYVPPCLKLGSVFAPGMEKAVYAALDALRADALLCYGDGTVSRYLCDRQYGVCGERLPMGEEA